MTEGTDEADVVVIGGGAAGEVAGVEVVDDRLVGLRMRDGRLVGRDAVAVATRMVARAVAAYRHAAPPSPSERPLPQALSAGSRR